MNKNFYSATMLTRYINCKHTITNEFNEKYGAGEFDIDNGTFTPIS